MLLFYRLPLLALVVCALSVNAQTPPASAAEAKSSALNSELFYQLLLGELNARGGEPGAAYSLMLDAARKTNDPRLYQRAVDIALQARSGDSALLAARAWKQALPASREANRYVLQILIGLNRIGETLEPLRREVATADAKDRIATILGLPRYFARATEKKLAAATVEQALAGYKSAPGFGAAAWTAIGRMRFEADDANGALNAARIAQSQDVGSEYPALLAVVMMNAKVAQAEAIVEKYLENEPKPEVRMDYARALLDAQRYAQALTQLQFVTLDKPAYADAWLIRGVLELEAGQAVVAERSLTQYVELALAQRESTPRPELSRGLTQAYLALAQIAEQRKDFVMADAWLQRIDSKEGLLSAQLRRAALMARQGKFEDARQLIRRQPEVSAADARLKIGAEVQLLRDSKQYQSAYEVLAQARADNPDDLDFTYDLAMVAEKLGKLDEMEQLLRHLIAAKPEDPQSYNALGYSLADRGIRLVEAKQLILKALDYAPNDPFISDSLGWAEFRSGNLAQAQRILEAAFKARPDAEIAAHLGEVLWTQGQREQALNIWKQGVQLNAENETLLETLKRLRVTL